MILKDHLLPLLCLHTYNLHVGLYIMQHKKFNFYHRSTFKNLAIVERNP